MPTPADRGMRPITARRVWISPMSINASLRPLCAAPEGELRSRSLSSRVGQGILVGANGYIPFHGWGPLGCGILPLPEGSMEGEERPVLAEATGCDLAARSNPAAHVRTSSSISIPYFLMRCQTVTRLIPSILAAWV